MHLAVYLLLLLPVPMAPAARALAERLTPSLATWLLTAVALALAAASGLALALLTLAGLVRIPWVARMAELSPPTVRGGNLPTWSVTVPASVLLLVTVIALARSLWRRTRAYLACAQEASCLPGRRQVVVVDDRTAEAFTMPGRPGRIVVSTGMLQALDESEREVLVAHEQAHLFFHHYLFLNAVQLAATVNPLLRPLAATVAYTVERWSDEHAAWQTGDRRCAARAIGKAALAGRRTPTRSSTSDLLLGALGRYRRPEALGGPVPRRVAALLAPPLRSRPIPMAIAALLLAAIALCAHEAYHDLHHLLERAHTSPYTGDRPGEDRAPH